MQAEVTLSPALHKHFSVVGNFMNNTLINFKVTNRQLSLSFLTCYTRTLWITQNNLKTNACQIFLEALSAYAEDIQGYYDNMKQDVNADVGKHLWTSSKVQPFTSEINNSMETDDLIIVKAKITMKTTEEGGRRSGFKSGYRPNHVFELPVDLRNLKTYIGDIQFNDQKLIEPGETKIVTVRFLKIPDVQKYIKVGQKWFINEAARTLGFGEIIET